MAGATYFTKHIHLTDTTTGDPDEWLWTASNFIVNGAAKTLNPPNQEFVDATVQNAVFKLYSVPYQPPLSSFSVDITLTPSKNGVAGDPVTKTVSYP